MKALLPVALLFGLVSCAATPVVEALPPNTLTAAESADGWRLLFDGATTRGWRGYQRNEVPKGWKVEDGALVRAGSGGDLITEEQFESFLFECEWMISPGGNSGILFHVAEHREEVWETGPEMQILDNAAYGAGLDPKVSAGANYGLHAPERDVSRPVGEWNHARLAVRGAVVTHWLNGERLLSYQLGTPEWKALVAGTKFDAMPDYGRQRRGFIALQDHGNLVRFRSIKIRPLD